MSNAWDAIQQIKSKRNSLRERLEKRKKERQDILGNSSGNNPATTTAIASTSKLEERKVQTHEIFSTTDNGMSRIDVIACNSFLTLDKFLYFKLYITFSRIGSRD